MNIYKRSSLVEFYKQHPKSKKALESWYHDVIDKSWKKPSDIVKDYNKARPIKNNMVIFEVNGNDYRLIVEVNYEKGWVFIKFIGTHSEYDREEAETVNMHKKKKNKQ
jgi:mRNA interferase HigB